MLEIFQYDFMIRAFGAGLVVACVAPLIGNLLVMRRFSLIADTLSHLSLAGIAFGLLFQTQPFFSALVFTVACALIIEYIRSQQKIPGDAVLAMFLPGGLALAVILMTFSTGLNVNVLNYLFGSITTVSSDQLRFIIGVGGFVAAAFLFFYKPLLASSFDEESARVAGIPVVAMNVMLMVMTALVVTIAMQVVGALLVGALMIIPVTTSLHVSQSFQHNLFLSCFFGIVTVILGLFSAYYLNLPAGAAIVLMSLFIFGAVAVLKRFV